MNASPVPNRSVESLRNQFEVEKLLATRLRASTRGERTELFKILYDELFRLVPDHPRLTRVDEASYRNRVAHTQFNLLRSVLGKDKTLVEFAPGDCHLAGVVAPEVQRVIGVDISDQRPAGALSPPNFELVVYDGFNLQMPAESADVAFSYQFLEHLHPEDVKLHFELVAQLLKPGGVYVFDTPHRHSGPHDIARYFGDDLVCLHMQEWTYAEMRRVCRQAGFGRTQAYRRGRPMTSGMMNFVNDLAEGTLGLLPRRVRRLAARRIFPSVTMLAIKS